MKNKIKIINYKRYHQLGKTKGKQLRKGTSLIIYKYVNKLMGKLVRINK